MANIEVTQSRPDEAAPDPQPIDPKLKLLLSIGAILAAQGGEDSEFASLKNQARELATRDPIDTLLATVLGGGLLFHHLEKGKNPRCNTVWDAILYVATSLSVGYDDVFPKTQAGNALASAIHTFGPALAAQALQPPASRAAARDREAHRTNEELLAVNRAILQRLSEISASLQNK